MSTLSGKVAGGGVAETPDIQGLSIVPISRARAIAWASRRWTNVRAVRWSGAAGSTKAKVGRLGLLEAHREFDRKHRSGANFETFAFWRVHGRVQEAFAGLGGFPRAVYRAAKKDAAIAREQGHGAGQVHTKDYLAQRVGEGADQLHLDPFTAIGERLEKNAVRAAIELVPDAQQRQVLRLIYVDGLAQSEVCEVLGLSKTRISRFHSAGVETVQKLLLLGSALEQEHVAKSVAQLSERRPREVLLALYRDRLDYPSARSKLGVGATELEELHQASLEALLQHGRS